MCFKNEVAGPNMERYELRLHEIHIEVNCSESSFNQPTKENCRYFQLNLWLRI